jgi:DNA-binding XRE family transcriptional regulator
LEGVLFQRDLAKIIGVKKIIVLNLEREKTKPVKEEP